MTSPKPSRKKKAGPTPEFRGDRIPLDVTQEIVERKRIEASLRHNCDLLFALSLASQSVQQARTPEEIYSAVGREVKALKCDLAIFTPSDDRKYLSTTYTTFAAGLLRAAEKLTGIQTQGYLLPIQSRSVFSRVIDKGNAEFLRHTGEDAAQALPKSLRPLAEQLVSFLKVEQGIVAPLRVDGVILGVLTITGSKLEEGDVPSVEAFAAQVAISLKNVQLTQQLLKELDERKQAEKALQDSELRFRSLIEHGLDNISLLAADGSLLWESPAVIHALGYEYDQFKGRNIFELMHPDDMERAQLRFREIVSKPGNVIHSAFRLKHSNGSWRWMEGTATNLLHVPSINAVVVNYRDITENKQAEDFLQENARSLARAQRIGKLGDWDWDVEGNSLTWSDELYRIWGLGKDFPLTFDGIAGMIHPDDREMNLKAVREFLASRDEGEFEFRIICPDGTEKWIHQNIEVTRAPSGQPIRMFGIMQDITERKQAEQKLAQYSEHLEEMVQERTRELREAQEKLVRNEKLAVLGQLAGGVGHELRNPLAVINNALYFLKLIGADSSEKVKEYLGIIQTETRTAERIINDLLDFARIRSVDVEPVSASELTARVLERYPVPKTVRVRLEIPGDLLMLHADPRQVEQVLGNLVINACQAMCSTVSPVDGELLIKAHQEQEMIAIAVKDNGMGIPSENMDKIFEPLFTTKAKGIGLGLAVSRKLAEANGGRIEAQSEVGKGSTFILVLPVHNG